MSTTEFFDHFNQQLYISDNYFVPGEFSGNAMFQKQTRVRLQTHTKHLMTNILVDFFGDRDYLDVDERKDFIEIFYALFSLYVVR